MSLQAFLADLHVHTALSPCAEREMSPPAIAHTAARRGVRLLGVCDHNSAENAVAVARAGEAVRVAVICGMEVQTREDVHVLTFFEDARALLAWQTEVYASLPDVENDEAKFGEQVTMDPEGAPKGKVTRVLLASTDMGIDYVGRRVRQLGGLVVPAHVDRPSFSLIRNLGFVPQGLVPDALEVSPRTGAARAKVMFPQVAGFPIVVSSDAHRLDEIRGYTMFVIGEPTLDEIRLALTGLSGRAAVPTAAGLQGGRND